MTLTRWKLTIEYKGTAFAGWQRQENAPSVQQHIEEAITKFCAQEARLHVAGRTDAGVHARGQVAHVDLLPFKKDMDGYEVAKAINAHLRPKPISVVRAEIVSEEFHARFSAVNKLYEYKILNRPALLTMEQDLVWQFKRKLDVEAMREGAKYLLGTHDFTTFRATECQAKSPIKTLERLDILTSPDPASGGVNIRFEVEGRSFLHHQVRNMVGTLSLVGDAKWQPQDVKTALEARDRKAGGITSPPDGLYLMRVDY